MAADTVPAVLREQASRRGDHPLLICDHDVLTYADAASRSAELAQGLVAVGAGKRTHVGLLYPNGSDFVVGWLAGARIGAVTVPLSTFSTTSELRTLLRNADIELLLATPSFRGRDYVIDVPHPDVSLPALRQVVFDTAELRRLDRLADGEGDNEPEVRPSDRLVIVHTS